VLAHGAVLLVLLLVQRLEQARFLGLKLAAHEWAALLVPELGFVLLFEAFWLVAGRWLARHRRLWAAAFVGAHLLVYAAAFLGQVFFLHTGTRLRFDLVVYALGHVKMLEGILSVGFDRAFYLRLALVLLSFLLALRLSAERSGAARSPLRLALAFAAVGVAATVLPPIAAGRLASFTRSEVVSFVRSASLLRRLEAGGAAAPADRGAEIYERPEVDALEGERRPNLVLVILESTRADVVAPYSAEDDPLTPAMAALARRGLAFDQVYATVSHTSKALVGILCGFYPRLEMPISESLRDGLPLACLPELLGAAGYRSAFLQTALGRFENRPGLVRNLGYQLGAFQETLRRPGFDELGYLGMDEFAMLEPALQWARAGAGAPYFLTLLTICPHHPYEAPGGVLAEPRQDYLRAIRHQDRFLGALLAGLEESPGLADTVVVVVGDHGEAFGEHVRLQHDAVPYEEVVRVPLVVAGPAARLGPPRRVGGLRHQIDLLPTLLELAGVRLAGRLPGQSLLSSAGHDWVLSSCWYTDHCLGMRQGDLKFVYHFGQQPTQLFDLARDPLELDDLASRWSLAELRSAEARMLERKQAVDGFWSRHPPSDLRAGWWLRE
jgi:hypothetical protein